MTEPAQVPRGQVWLVTGGSRGLGRAVVEQALAAGHRVVATARDVGSMSNLVEQYGDRVLTAVLDVRDPQQARTVVDDTVSTFGRLDVVVNNAGYADLAPIEQISLDNFRDQVEVCFFGTVYVTKAALPVFLAQGSGHFIQVTSIGGRLTAPGVGAYQSAKFAVEGFSGVLAEETAGLGIKVTLAEPGAMRTDWAGSSMTIPPIEPRYDPTVGAMARYLRSVTGTEPIDPVKVAKVLIDVARMSEPPRHLVLGRSAVDHVAQVMKDLRTEDERWAELGRSVDYD
ncbi:SDR family NAD(P)-dependent oxidoreductase [Nocardia sp. NPDC004722]